MREEGVKFSVLSKNTENDVIEFVHDSLAQLIDEFLARCNLASRWLSNDRQTTPAAGKSLYMASISRVWHANQLMMMMNHYDVAIPCIMYWKASSIMSKPPNDVIRFHTKRTRCFP